MAYEQALSMGAGVSGPLAMPSLSGQIDMQRSPHVAYAAAGSGTPAHASAPSTGPTPAPNDIKPFTAEDYRRELARVRKVRKRIIVLVVVLVVLIAAAVALAIASGTAARTVSGTAMEPVLSEGQAIVTVKTQDLRTGSVVAYNDDGGELRFKRIVAEPGDWVSVAPDGTVAVSEEKLSTESARNVFGSNASSITSREVPAGSYYMLGDAEDATVNGLTSEADFIDGDQVVGQAVARVWPLTSVGPVS